MFDLLTVVFRDEINVLQVQAQSVDLYCQDIGIQRIFVIVNDDDCVADQINPAWWGTLRENVTVVKRSSFNTQFVNDGWLSQQALKILGSQLSSNNYTVVLDAKTIFVQNLNINYIFDPSGAICVGSMPVFDVFKPSQIIINDFFNINLTHVIGPAGVPFWFNNNIINAMVDYVEQQTKQDFAAWFQEQGMLTEFILYSGFVFYTYKSFDVIISDTYYQFQNVCHSAVGSFDSKFELMQEQKVLTVSVHRHAWKHLSKKQKENFVNFLVSKKITQAKTLL